MGKTKKKGEVYIYREIDKNAREVNYISVL